MFIGGYNIIDFKGTTLTSEDSQIIQDPEIVDSILASTKFAVIENIKYNDGDLSH